jgi:hypothetical protein
MGGCEEKSASFSMNIGNRPYSEPLHTSQVCVHVNLQIVNLRRRDIRYNFLDEASLELSIVGPHGGKLVLRLETNENLPHQGFKIMHFAIQLRPRLQVTRALPPDNPTVISAHLGI